jgi:hypothetical protein
MITIIIIIITMLSVTVVRGCYEVHEASLKKVSVFLIARHQISSIPPACNSPQMQHACKPHTQTLQPRFMTCMHAYASIYACMSHDNCQMLSNFFTSECLSVFVGTFCFLPLCFNLNFSLCILYHLIMILIRASTHAGMHACTVLIYTTFT